MENKELMSANDNILITVKTVHLTKKQFKAYLRNQVKKEAIKYLQIKTINFEQFIYVVNRTTVKLQHKHNMYTNNTKITTLESVLRVLKKQSNRK